MGEWRKENREHERRFRQVCRRQLRAMSDAAVAYQLRRDVGGWEREEIAREGERRGLG